MKRGTNGLALLTATAALLLPLSAGTLFAAGTLTSKGSADAPIQIRDHRVHVVLDNGWAETEVVQTFFNPNARDLEALYSFPLPKSASLAEVTITSGEKEIHGEVLPKDDAKKAYEEERDAGNDSGLASKNGFQSFDFAVSPVRANSETKIRFLYYQPLEIDTGVGRYLYPLESGGTDDAAERFWTRNEKVEGDIAIEVELKSGWPVDDVRVAGFESEAQIQKISPEHYKASLTRTGAALDRDFVFYYRLAENLPGRVELSAYRPDKSKPGTFLMVVTPGLDLKPIDKGADYVFVLDVSGSMDSKIRTLAKAVDKTLRGFRPDDRYRIVTFNDSAQEVTSGFVAATPDNVAATLRQLEQIHSSGSTNLYDGLELGMKGLDDDRATALILVTDGVTNTGVVDPAAFTKLLQSVDIRVFGFVMGNSANWPLMQAIARASGGFSAGVSNDDDILGQILLAKSKIRYECLHGAKLSISGVKTFDTSSELLGKVYRGQQLVWFGHYDGAGKARVTLAAKLTGADRTYATTFDFPEIDTSNPELERLWALDRTEQIVGKVYAGEMPESEAKGVIRDLGVKYQIVTDETSMVVLTDEAFSKRGIERRNAQRIAIEQQAKASRVSSPPPSRHVDRAQPMFPHSAPSLGHGGGGGGAIDPATAALALGLGALGLLGRAKARRKKECAS